MMSRGMLISFEGIDGAGKSTQIKALERELRAKGYKVSTLREPGGTKISEQIRELLLDSSSRINPVAEALLYAAARAQLVQDVVRPLLDEGAIVLADRFIDSTIAYQGYGRGLDIEGLHRLNFLATGGLEPDLTILLDIPVDLSSRRRQGMLSDRMEKEGMAFQDRVRRGYLEMAGKLPRFRVINGSLPEESISAIIIDIVVRFLKGDKRD
ncbi:MAG: dTMP kinase [Syntrophomonadales bacterium]|jgi:dTMP kinase